jgi:hypothetical protein
MKKKLPVVEAFGRNRITPRYDQEYNMKKMVGRTLRCNMFPTLLGRLLYTHQERCYFVMVENDKWTKYNNCAGTVEYLNEHTVMTMKFEDESETN